jgi:hypothetical protein
MKEKDQTIADLDKKLKHMEKKYEKQLSKMQNDLIKFKKKYEAML